MIALRPGARGGAIARLLLAAAGAVVVSVAVLLLSAGSQPAGGRRPPGPAGLGLACRPGAVAPLVSPSPAGSQPGQTARAQVLICPGAEIRTVPGSFLGISTEVGSLALFEQHGLLFDRVLALLRRPGEGPLIVRAGGTSADGAFWDPSGQRLAPWAYGITPAWFRRTAEVLGPLGARLLVDLNLATATPANAVQVAEAAERELARGEIAGFEVGNEPDLYGASRGLATIARGGLQAARVALEMSRGAYARVFDNYARRLEKIVPGVVLAGPALAYPRNDADWISTLLSRPHPGLGIISAHLYPYTACAGPRSPEYPTIARLLSGNATADLARLVRTAARRAHHAGLAFRLTELNSVSCGGRPGVSNAFATALWAPDALFELLAAGVDGVNVHVREDAINGAFALTGRGLTARPLLYGLILVARTLGPGAALVDVRVRAPRSLSLKVWAVRLGDGRLRVLLIDQGRRSARVDLQLAPGSGATVQRLLAPSAAARFAVTLDGQRLDRDGRWRGRAADATLSPGRQGYELTVSPHSAALVSVRRPGRGR